MIRGEIYIARLKGSGSIQKGVRPVVVIQNDTGNNHSPTTIVACVTRQVKKETQPTHVLLEYHESVDGMILCEQLYTLNKKDLRKCVGHLNDSELTSLDRALCVSLDINKSSRKGDKLCQKSK